MHLFFDPTLTAKQNEIIFNNEESRHIARVLRKKENDPIVVTNGNGLEWQGVLKNIDQRNTLAVQSNFIQHTSKKKKIHIAIAPTKSNDRMEWFLEKATEIGISTITPLLCQHSERKIIKVARYEKILISALKQSQQFFIPELKPLISMAAFVKKYSRPHYIAHCEKGQKTVLSSFDFNNEETTVLIGPEGDFSSEEIALSLASNGIPITLGNNRLRTETAGIVALNTIVLKQSLNEIKTN